VSVSRRSAGIKLALCFGAAALALSACGGSSTHGVLTSADVPSYLGVAPNASATADYGNRLIAPTGCQTAGVAVFSIPGKAVNAAKLPSSANGPVVSEILSSCTKQSTLYRDFIGGVSEPIFGFGEQADLVDNGGGGFGGGLLWSVSWRNGEHFGIMSLSGPGSDRRLGLKLDELLARRGAAKW
jgi:hypothetical protein